jgi:hypothetical protein
MRVLTHMCIRCREAEAQGELGLCEQCAIATCIEYLTGLERLSQYLSAWAAFQDWQDQKLQAA